MLLNLNYRVFEKEATALRQENPGLLSGRKKIVLSRHKNSTREVVQLRVTAEMTAFWELHSYHPECVTILTHRNSKRGCERPHLALRPERPPGRQMCSSGTRSSSVV